MERSKFNLNIRWRDLKLKLGQPLNVFLLPRTTFISLNEDKEEDEDEEHDEDTDEE